MTSLADERLLLPTPLHSRTAPACLANDWVAEGRYMVARSYRSAGEEAAALLARAGLADISPLVKYRITGKDAEAALDYLCASRVAGLSNGALRHALWCDDDGFVVGDGMLLRMSARLFLLFTGLPGFAWLEDGLRPFEARLEDVTEALAGVAVMGPSAPAVLEATGLAAVAKLSEEAGALVSFQGLEIIAMRTGMEPSFACSLWTAASAAPLLWDRLMAAGARLGLLPVGAAACEVARLEAGLPKLGLDFLPAARVVPPASAASPYALGLGALVDKGKTRFVGEAALAGLPEEPQCLVRLAIAGEEAASGLRVLAGGRSVGFTTSAAYAPRYECCLAFAFLERRALAEPLAVALPPAHDRGAGPRLVPAVLAATDFGMPAKAAQGRPEPPALVGRMGERPAPPEGTVKAP